jgi:hypothetical protein
MSEIACFRQLTDYNRCWSVTNTLSNDRTRLAEIAKRPGCDQVFGAGDKGHRFELTLHSPDEIALLEEQLGVRLPQDYAKVLMATGSGAGPYYGLFAPGRILAEIDFWNGIVRKEGGPETSPSAPFPFRQSDADEICSRQKIDPSETLGRATYPCDGCIPICCQGCTLFGVLVTAGEQLGRVWSVNSDGRPNADWRPGVRPPGLLSGLRRDGSYARFGESDRGFVPKPLSSPSMPPTFLQWYGSWLERVETDLDDYRDYMACDELR